MKIAIIPARGGSQRIPRKNLRAFHGRPIIDYSIDAALQETELFDAVYVSTDDAEIARHAAARGCLIHPRTEAAAHLAHNDVGTQEVARAAILWAEEARQDVTHACVIYATAPMLNRTDLWRGWEQVRNGQRAFAFGVGTQPLQDAGQFYWGTVKAFVARRPLISPHSSMIPIEAERVCDINVEADFCRAEQMYAALRGVTT